MRLPPRRGPGLRAAGRRFGLEAVLRAGRERVAIPAATLPGAAFLHLGDALGECVQAWELGRVA